ncbi:lanthionine synthetase C family protein [Psychroserpens luteolus]|uniref:lanthionine synthetase C family protein n=1 Tax=Psychroserpens luteolus TaxID=2855840 RepID=UPI001E354D50|nr:lanthionine synthetase C family protein [Psychroserpens luteolus]MCD2258058.1 lanthionine synthetase C family protein [Psychroserpens luteolus]
MNKHLLEAKLAEISKIIETEYINEEHIGLMSGLSGMALFQFYYSKYLDIEDNANFGANILSHCIEKINHGYNSPLYSNGIAGFGWTLDFLELNHFIEIGSDDLLKDIDDYLYTALDANFKQDNYDFLHGAIGQVYYFLYRYQNTSSAALKEKYKSILLEFISFLENQSKKEEEGLKWLSILTFQPIQKGYNLCLSHGISSIVFILAKLYEENIIKNRVAFLLRGAISYIKRFKNTEKETYCLFPNWVTQDNIPEGQSRLAWCYGDLGIGVALFKASKALKDNNLKTEALTILKHTTSRKTTKDTKVEDAGLCHGAFGNALIYTRLYRETSDTIFKDALEFWITEGIKMASFDDGFAGYKMWNPDNETWSKDLSLLTGITGIGLAMISYLSDFDAHWDECLIIN